MTDGNGIKTVYAYDSRDNRTSISIGVLALFLDASNHVVIDNLNGAHAKTFGYDEFNQLTSETDGLGFTESYTYDRVGNRTHRHRPPDSRHGGTIRRAEPRRVGDRSARVPRHSASRRIATTATTTS